MNLTPTATELGSFRFSLSLLLGPNWPRTDCQEPLSGREVLRLGHRGASQQGVQNALDELAAHGLVTQVTAGNAVLTP